MRADGMAGTVEATTTIHAPHVMVNLTIGSAKIKFLAPVLFRGFLFSIFSRMTGLFRY